MGGGSGGGGGSAGTEELVANVVCECLARLPDNFDIEAVQRKWPVMYEESMNTVLAQVSNANIYFCINGTIFVC